MLFYAVIITFCDEFSLTLTTFISGPDELSLLCVKIQSQARGLCATHCLPVIKSQELDKQETNSTFRSPAHIAARSYNVAMKSYSTLCAPLCSRCDERLQINLVCHCTVPTSDAVMFDICMSKNNSVQNVCLAFCIRARTVKCRVFLHINYSSCYLLNFHIELRC